MFCSFFAEKKSWGPRCVKVKFSIRYKILSVVTVLLVAAISFYLLLATKVFKQDKTELVFDLNRGLVSTLSAEVDTSLRGAADKLKLYALLNSDAKQTKVFEQILQNDPFLVQVELYERGFDGSLKLISKISDHQFQNLYGLSKDYFTSVIPSQKPIPFDAIQSASKHVWNASLDEGPPLMGLGVAVIQEGANSKPQKMMAVIGYLKADSFLKNLKSSSLTQAFIIDKKGRVLLHQYKDAMVNVEDFSEYPLVKELSKNQFTNGVLEFNYKGQNFLGAYSKAPFSGVSVVSQAESEKAFMAVDHLMRRSFIFALIVCTITFIATILFSRSLTLPLQNLLNAMEKVRGGNLDAALKIKSHDEISVLSNSFNEMTSDLKTSRLQLEEINRDLENKVADRTKKLEEQNHAVKEAQEALLRTTRLASVGEIAGRTAHEVLNPLTSIMTRIQKVQKRLTDEIMNDKNLLGEIVKAWREDFDQKGQEGFVKALNQPSEINPAMTLLQEDLDNIGAIFKRWDNGINTLDADSKFLLSQATRIEKILGSMRSLSHVSGEKGEHHASEVLHSAVNISADLFAKNKVKLIEDYKTDLDGIVVDKDELIQVLTNLLKNSLHAVLEKKRTDGYVQISSYNKDNMVIIDIIDNGCGISKENQSHIFENQFSTKSPEMGTGLGLSISRRFVRAYNGDLFLVSSIPGEKTCFRIELPLFIKTQEAAA